MFAVILADTTALETMEGVARALSEIEGSHQSSQAQAARREHAAAFDWAEAARRTLVLLSGAAGSATTT